MADTLVQNYLHIVFSTKNRQPLIRSEFKEELFSYLGGITNKLNCQTLKTGGHVDHIHQICMLSQNIALKKLIQELKTGSSSWLKTKFPDLKNFYWQEGYGAFSVNPEDVQTVIEYISNQEIHHSKKTFQEEYRFFLNNSNVVYKEKYIWG